MRVVLQTLLTTIGYRLCCNWPDHAVPENLTPAYGCSVLLHSMYRMVQWRYSFKYTVRLFLDYSGSDCDMIESWANMSSSLYR